MTLKQLELEIFELICSMKESLAKARNGNKAAAQRLRLATIEFAKVAKEYRKASVQEEMKRPKRVVNFKVKPVSPKKRK